MATRSRVRLLGYVRFRLGKDVCETKTDATDATATDATATNAENAKKKCDQPDGIRRFPIPCLSACCANGGWVLCVC